MRNRSKRAASLYGHLTANSLLTYLFKGLISNNSIHAGIRAPVARPKEDMQNDRRCGFSLITARDLDKFGASAIVQKIKERVGDSKVYISVDIDVLDPAFAPGEWSPLLE